MLNKFNGEEFAGKQISNHSQKQHSLPVPFKILSHSSSTVAVNIAYHQGSGFSPSFPFKAVLSPYYDIRSPVCPITIVTPPKNSVRLEKSFTFLILVSAR